MQRLRDAIDELPAQRCARELLDAVPPVIWFIRREMREFRRGMSLPQFRALAFVQRSPSASLSALAEHVGATLPTVSRLVQGLVEKGLMKRTGCTDDRRQLALAITDSGEEVLNSAWAGTQNRLTAEIQRLPAEKRQAIVEAMRSLKEVFGALGLCECGNGNIKLMRPSATKLKAGCAEQD
jgi:DNA-binding MarR family transcriptional regulator